MKRKEKGEDNEIQGKKKHKYNTEIKVSKEKKSPVNSTSLRSGTLTDINKEESSTIPVGFRHSKSETQTRKLVKKKPNVKKFLDAKNKFGSIKKAATPQKPDWTKFKAEKKTIKHKRKVERTGHEHFELTVKCKRIWEKLRRSDCDTEARSRLLEELFVLVKGQIHVVIHTHDMARVVQWLLKLGCEDIRMSVCEELCAHLISLLQSKYASFCVKRALKYSASESRRHMIDCVKGSVVKLLSHAIAAPIIELMYSTWATAPERAQMRLELYGDLCSKFIRPENQPVSILECVSTDMRPAVLSATKANLEKLIDKKHMINSTLLHAVMLDFLRKCDENDRKEMLENVNPHLPELMNSKNGINIAAIIVQNGTNKIKKIAVKSIKGRVKEIATSEHGHSFLMAIFDYVDDTVLVKRAVIPELLADALDIVRNDYGRKVLLYLVAHKDPLYFHPKRIKTVEKNISAGTSKKDATLREKELLESVSGPLLKQIANDPATWIGDTSLAMFSLAVLKSGFGEELSQALDKVADYACDKNSKVLYNNRMYHSVEHSTLHMVYKKLIQHDKHNLEKGLSTFSKAFVENLTNDRLQNLLELNRGCFLLVGILEAGDNDAIDSFKSKVTKAIEKLLSNQETTGAQILLKKLKKDENIKL